MRKIDLYIAGQKVDLDENSFIFFNYTREEMSNPTIVRNSYSKEITIPGTPNNNRLFGAIYHYDRATIIGESNKGVEYNANRKADFALFAEDGTMLQKGYVKFNSVLKEGGVLQYKLNLFGGLGTFFYDLTYKEDGSKKTLADLTYTGESGNFSPYDLTFNYNAEYVKEAWDTIRSETGRYPSKNMHSILNFMPCYNGFPDKFDCDKAYYKPFSKSRNFPNLYVSKNGYSSHPDADGGILIEMKNKHTEWEMQDLRSYLQRPVIRLFSVFEAMTNKKYGGYQLIVDELTNILNPDNEIWMTLPLLNWESYTEIGFQEVLWSDILKGTLSPAEYLISFAKMMGYVFVTDNAAGIVTMMSRNEFFSRQKNNVIDLSDRVDVSSIDIIPCAAQSQYYVLETDNYGEEAKKYEERYGQKYGCQIINTGYEFNSEKKKLLESFSFKGACDVLESNLNFQIFGGDADDEYGDYQNYLFKMAFTEEISWKLYKRGTDGQLVDETFAPTRFWLAPYSYSGKIDYNDFFPKVQFHGEDNKPEEGSNVLVVYNGDVSPFAHREGSFTIADVRFYLTDDTQAMLDLNGGKPCWNLSSVNSVRVSTMPSFRRLATNEDLHITLFSLDFGAAKETYVNDADESLEYNAYYARWKSYIGDIYDADTKILKCKVNLSGLQVNDWLLGRFFWYENALWVLNKITNYSITTDDLTECEFIKVKDINNYTQGQKNII